jgi:hypothetical protein
MTPTTSDERDERTKLLKECIVLLHRVAHRPGGVKLLLGVKQQLILFNNYKRNRSYGKRQSGSTQPE